MLWIEYFRMTRALARTVLASPAVAASQLLGHTHPAIRVWAVLSLVMCLLPVAIWAAGSARRQVPAPQPAPSPAVVRAAAPRTPAVTFAGNRVVDVPVPQESSR